MSARKEGQGKEPPCKAAQVSMPPVESRALPCNTHTGCSGQASAPLWDLCSCANCSAGFSGATAAPGEREVGSRQENFLFIKQSNPSPASSPTRSLPWWRKKDAELLGEELDTSWHEAPASEWLVKQTSLLMCAASATPVQLPGWRNYFNASLLRMGNL